MSELTFKQMTEEARHMSRDAFVRKYPHPFLVAEARGAGGSGVGTGRREVGHFQTVAGLPDINEVMAAADARIVHTVQKSGRNHFGDMITLGRAANNDVIVSVASVSKFHAYINQDLEGGYVLCDASSTFGTSLRGRWLTADEPAPVNSGDRITLGEKVVLTFFLPGDFYANLRMW